MENNALQVDYSNWEKGKQYPEWMDEISLATISKGYLLPNETSNCYLLPNWENSL